MAGQRTIIVTGASRGIGHATALRFRAEGWRVITVSRQPPPGSMPRMISAPGEIDTAILSPRTSEIVDHDIPMRRLGMIEEVADLIWFLCSEQASYITAAEIPINGGQHA